MYSLKVHGKRVFSEIRYEPFQRMKSKSQRQEIKLVWLKSMDWTCVSTTFTRCGKGEQHRWFCCRLQSLLRERLCRVINWPNWKIFIVFSHLSQSRFQWQCKCSDPNWWELLAFTIEHPPGLQIKRGWLIVNATDFPQFGVWAFRIFTWKSSSFCWSLMTILAQDVTCMLKNQGSRSQPVSIKLWDSESSWKLRSIEHPRTQLYLGLDQKLPVPIGSAILHNLEVF